MLVSSCNKAPYHKQIADTIDYLSSSKLEGRLPDTEGNRLAKAYIENSLAFYHVAPYGENGYRQAYTYQEFTIANAAIRTGDFQLSFNQDFQVIECPVGNIHILSTLQTSPTETPCVVLADISNFRSYLEEPTVQAAIVNFQTIERRFAIYEQNMGDKPVFVVEDSVYQQLLSCVGTTVEIELEGDLREHTEENIIGKLANADTPSSEAIVVSAHFDHLGRYQDQIYHGALDNASGVASLLELAKISSETFDLTELKRDVIFAFFNTEETGLSHSGSHHFSQEIQSDYTAVYNINIDCIGEKGKDLIIGYTNGAAPVQAYMAQRATEIFEGHKIATCTAEQYGSDHVNFQNSICLTTGFENANTLYDTTDILDFDAVCAMTNAAAQLLHELAADPLSLSEQSEGAGARNAPTFPSGLFCEVVEDQGHRRHFMSSSFSAIINPVAAISKKELAFSNLYPLHLEALVPDETSVLIYTRAALRAGIPAAASNSIQLPLPPSGVCPYTGLPLEDHVPGQQYQGATRLDDIGLITFTLPDRMTITDTSVQIEQADILSISCYDRTRQGDMLLYEEDISAAAAAEPIFEPHRGYLIMFSEPHQMLIAKKAVGSSQFLIQYQFAGPRPITQELLLQRADEHGIFTLCDAFLEGAGQHS